MRCLSFVLLFVAQAAWARVPYQPLAEEVELPPVLEDEIYERAVYVDPVSESRATGEYATRMHSC